MTKLVPETVLDESEVLVIAALALGMGQEDAGRFAISAAYPAGISGRSVRKWMEAKPDLFERLIRNIKGVVAREHREFADMTRQQFREKLQKLRSKSAAVTEKVLDAALDNATDVQFLSLGLKAAQNIEDRDLGKAKQMVGYDGNVTVDHFVTTRHTQQDLLEQENDIEASQNLLSGLPAEVFEAEVVAEP